LSEARRAALLEALHRYRAGDDVERTSLARIIAFVERTPAPFDRATPEGHITGSAIVMSGSGERFFVLHHRKLDRWLQPGGHSDPGDASTLATAMREALEETGLSDLTPGNDGEIIDVDTHDIPAREEEPGHVHYDIRYLLITGGAATTYNADEAADARWATLAELDALDVDASLRRALLKAVRIQKRVAHRT
jgi:8-oxo-dGTP pyrophosphatase MutT (NUDIX family)